MARLDRGRLDAADFPVTSIISTRYTDLDPLGHVNNAAVAVIFQEARGKMEEAAGTLEYFREHRSVVVSLCIEYAAELFFPDPVEVSTGVLHLGRTSITIGQVARQRGRTAAYAEVVLVFADDNGSKPIPEEMRAGYERMLL